MVGRTTRQAADVYAQIRRSVPHVQVSHFNLIQLILIQLCGQTAWLLKGLLARTTMNNAVSGDVGSCLEFK